jgi:hypothetical protein
VGAGIVTFIKLSCFGVGLGEIYDFKLKRIFIKGGIIYKKVGRFDISVNYVGLMQAHDSIDDLFC